jgi:hypothetical protein
MLRIPLEEQIEMESQKVNEMIIPKYCGYSNCFRPFYKMRGFMPCCELHYKLPKKWGRDGETYTGSVFIYLLSENEK